MTAPVIAAQRFGGAVLVGVVLGLIYGFLRPLRPGYTVFSDLAFLLALVWGWVYLALEICRGEFRFSYCFGMLLGGFGWESLVGRQIRGIFSAFWKSMGQIRDIALFPLKKIYKILKKISDGAESDYIGIPKVYDTPSNNSFNSYVMDLLGDTLESCKNNGNGCADERDVLRYAIDMINAVKEVFLWNLQ